jgi:hypothetical protein
VTTRDRLPVTVTVTVTDFSKILATVTARDRDRDRDNRESRRSRRTLVGTQVCEEEYEALNQEIQALGHL